MKHDYHMKLKSNGETINIIPLLAITKYQAKKEFYRDVAEKLYFEALWISSPSTELCRNDGKFIKKIRVSIGETK